MEHAFPIIVQTENDGFKETEIEQGLSKREYFAAKALQGLLAKAGDPNLIEVAGRAVRAADALMKALNN